MNLTVKVPTWALPEPRIADVWQQNDAWPLWEHPSAVALKISGRPRDLLRLWQRFRVWVVQPLEKCATVPGKGGLGIRPPGCGGSIWGGGVRVKLNSANIVTVTIDGQVLEAGNTVECIRSDLSATCEILYTSGCFRFPSSCLSEALEVAVTSERQFLARGQRKSRSHSRTGAVVSNTAVADATLMIHFIGG